MAAHDDEVAGRLGDRQRPGRRAVVLPLGGEAERIVDDVRRRWDPEMAARIDAHVTLLHDVVDHDALAMRLARLSARPPCRFTLTAAACWGPVRYGIFLAIDDHDGSIGALHAELAALEDPRWQQPVYRPHVTLLHGRTITDDVAARAWAELAAWSPDLDVGVDAIAVLELDDNRWHQVQRVEFRGAGQHSSAGLT